MEAFSNNLFAATNRFHRVSANSADEAVQRVCGAPACLQGAAQGTGIKSRLANPSLSEVVGRRGYVLPHFERVDSRKPGAWFGAIQSGRGVER